MVKNSKKTGKDAGSAQRRKKDSYEKRAKSGKTLTKIESAKTTPENNSPRSQRAPKSEFEFKTTAEINVGEFRVSSELNR